MKTTLIASILLIILNGCATLAQERHDANLLIGKNISEAAKYFGQQSSSYIDYADGPRHGEIVHVFVKNPGISSYDRVAGSDISQSGGGLVKTDYIEKVRYLTGCVISLWTNSEGTVNYYEVKGDCGVGGIGLGNTGIYHDRGIN